MGEDTEKILQVLRARAGRVHRDLVAAWSDVSAVDANLREAAFRVAAERRPPASIQEAQRYHRNTTGELLVAPWRRYNEMRPIRRRLEARRELARILLESFREAGWKLSRAQQAIGRRQPPHATFHEIPASACLGFREPWRRFRSPQPANPREWSERQAARDRAAGLMEIFQSTKTDRFRDDADLTGKLWRQRRTARGSWRLNAKSAGGAAPAIARHRAPRHTRVPRLRHAARLAEGVTAK